MYCRFDKINIKGGEREREREREDDESVHHSPRHTSFCRHVATVINNFITCTHCVA